MTPGSEAEEAGLRRWLARSAGAAVLLLFCLLVARSWFVCDDAYISFRYMRNWADGLGLRFNDAGPVVEGFSNPVWVALGTLARLVGLDETRVLPAFSAVLAVALVAGAAAWVARGRGWGVAAWGTLLLLAVNPAMAVWASSGLETLQYAAVWFAVLVAWVEGAPVAVRVALTGLLVASRPEGFLWAGVLAVLALPVAGFRDVLGRLIGTDAVPMTVTDLRERRRWIHAVSGTVLVTLILLGARWSVFHDLVPNTAHAKGDTGAWYYVRGVQYVAGASIETVLPALALPLVLANLRDAVVHRRWDRTAMLSLAAAGHYAFAVLTGGDYMAFGRFLVAGMALHALVVASWLEDTFSRRVGIAGVLGIAAVSLLPHFNVPLVPAFAREGTLNYRRVAGGMAYERLHMELERDDGVRNERVGRMLRQVVQPDETLYQTAIGRVGYFSHATLIDRCYLVERMPPGVHKSRDKKPGHDSCVMSLTPRELAARKAITNFDVVSVPLHAREDGTWSVGYPGGVLRTYYPAWELDPSHVEGQYLIVDRAVADEVPDASAAHGAGGGAE